MLSLEGVGVVIGEAHGPVWVVDEGRVGEVQIADEGLAEIHAAQRCEVGADRERDGDLVGRRVLCDAGEGNCHCSLVPAHRSHQLLIRAAPARLRFAERRAPIAIQKVPIIAFLLR